jgi:hypothetical protein
MPSCRRWLLLAALVAPGQALAQTPRMAGAEPASSGPTTTLVYLDGSGAPAAFASKIEERLRATLADHGIAIADTPQPAAPEAKLAAAKKDLDKGIAAYRALSINDAVAALQAAETEALGAAEVPQAAGIVADARLYRGLISLAGGNDAEAQKQLRAVLVLDPERKLESHAFAPDVVAAFEKARKAVVNGPSGELTVLCDADDAAMTVDGRPVTGPVKLPFGEHLIAAAADAGSAGDKLDLALPSVTRALKLQPDPGKLVAAVRAAAKHGDDASLARALDLVASASSAPRVLVWDLRSNAGHIEAPMRFRDAPGHAFSRATVADLGNGVTPDNALRAAVGTLLNPVIDHPVAVGTPGHARSHRPSGGGIAPWVWWVGGGLAVVAAGGAAAALAQPPAGGDNVAVKVQH